MAQDTKVVIFAGGMGMRLREETEFKPKPMVLVGNIPIIVHIMKMYAHHGFNNFIIALGYRGDVIKNYFLNYVALNQNVHVDLKRNKVDFFGEETDDFKVTLVDTGLECMTGARLRKLRPYIGQETFMATYGDGVADVDIGKLFDFHKKHGKTATVTGVRPSSRWGELNIRENTVIDFKEKPQVTGSYINGGFFVFEPEFFDYLEGDDTLQLEREPLEKVSAEGNLMIYKHDGMWSCIDTYKDLLEMNRMWSNGAPWAVWRK
jgi:glucose-1-phosphate cytidylyltransferase